MAESFNKGLFFKLWIEGCVWCACFGISCVQASKDGFGWLIPALIAYGLAPTVLNDFERSQEAVRNGSIKRYDLIGKKSKPWEWWLIGVFGLAVLGFIVYLFLYQID